MTGIKDLPGKAGHHLHGVGAADADRARAEAAGVRRVGVGPDDQLARERVLLEHDLVDDPGARPPESCAVLRRRRLQEIVDLLILGQRLAQVGLALDTRLNEVVAVDRGRHRDSLTARLHELQHGRLAEHVLQHDAVRAKEEVALAGFHRLVLRIVRVSQQDLVGQGQRPAEPAPDDREIPLHRLVDFRSHVSSRFDRHHFRCPPPRASRALE